MPGRRTTLPAPAQPEDDPRWNEKRTSREEYLYFQRQEDAIAAAREGGFNQHQGRPGEVYPYRPGSRLAFLNPRLDQMEATARWAAADEATRGERPSMNPQDELGTLANGVIDLHWWDETIPLPWKCGLGSIRERDA
jgi:hypothetical protein